MQAKYFLASARHRAMTCSQGWAEKSADSCRWSRRISSWVSWGS